MSLPRDQEALRRDETRQLISADKVEGTDVYTRNGDHLGKIEKVMIDKLSGQVAYVVLSFGGILGIGESRRALPWDVLHYDTERDGYVVDLDLDALRGLPEYSGEADLGNRDWLDRMARSLGRRGPL